MPAPTPSRDLKPKVFYRTQKGEALPQLPSGENRGTFDYDLTKSIESVRNNSSDDFQLIARAFKDLTDLLIDKATFLEAELSQNMVDLRSQK